MAHLLISWPEQGKANAAVGGDELCTSECLAIEELCGYWLNDDDELILGNLL